jgi:hypothetical protein
MLNFLVVKNGYKKIDCTLPLCILNESDSNTIDIQKIKDIRICRIFHL